MNSNVTSAASGGLSGALVVVALFVLKKFGIEVPPEVSAASLVVLHTFMHPMVNKSVTNAAAKAAVADVAKQAQENLKAKLVEQISKAA